jgi:hypothetical protein
MNTDARCPATVRAMADVARRGRTFLGDPAFRAPLSRTAPSWASSASSLACADVRGEASAGDGASPVLFIEAGVRIEITEIERRNIYSRLARRRGDHRTGPQRRCGPPPAFC